MLLLVYLLIGSAWSFQPLLSSKSRFVVHSRSLTGIHATKASDGTMDTDRVRECADSFGKCSVDELKELKEGRHNAVNNRNQGNETAHTIVIDIINNRVQQFVMKGEVGSKDLHHLEEEIDIQIGLFETQNNAAKAASNMNLSSSVPARKSKDHVKYNGHLLDIPSAAEMLQFEETLVEENLMEPLAMCFVVALLVFLPQLLS